MDVEAVQILQRMKRQMSWMKQDMALRSDQNTKQQIEELEALLDMLERKIAE
tara:strand:+ start:470 stop:625 length:156 start_codon:yes stop_codon:yes gene_type:complete